eukprot:1073529-Pyramimonas_sp.AAC.1
MCLLVSLRVDLTPCPETRIGMSSGPFELSVIMVRSKTLSPKFWAKPCVPGRSRALSAGPR